MSLDRENAHNRLVDVLGGTDLQAMLVDAAGRVSYVSPRLETMLAVSPGALESAPLDSIFSPRNPEWLSPDIRRKAAAGSWAGDAVIRRRDGTEWWARIQACKLPEEHADAGALLLIIEDATERIEITSALMRRTQELYDRNWELEIINSVGHLLIANKDLESRLNAVLREAANSAKADAGFVLIKDRRTGDILCRAVFGDSVPRSVVGDVLPTLEDSLALRTIQTCRTQSIVDSGKSPRGISALAEHYGIKSVLSVPMGIGDEAFGSIMLGRLKPEEFDPQETTLVEIIAHHVALAINNAFLGEDIEMSRAYWQRTFDAIGDVMAIIGPKGTIVRANESLAWLLGVHAVDLDGQDCVGLLPGVDPQALRRIFETGEPEAMGDITIAGEVCEASAYPLLDETRMVDAVAFYGKIITKERRLADEVRRASRLASVGELLAGAAHNFGNVLMAIQGTLESAKRALAEGPASDGASERVDQALGHATKGTQIVRRLLSFSRGVEEKPTAVSLYDIVEAALSLSRTHPAAKQRGLRNLVPRDLPKVEARPGPLQEVVLNLVLNALQATDPGGEVRVEAEIDEAEGRAFLRIIDNGCGMSPDTARRIFEPFFSTKSGTGLGLSTSAAAIHRMGGLISAESELEKGACFTVRLNLKDRAQSDQPKAA